MIPGNFFAQSPKIVARKILGKTLVHKSKEGITKGIIVETEAYCGRKDPASQGYKGRKTKSNKLIWGPPGYAYIYSTHMGYCMFNIVTGKINEPSSVFIRAVEPVKGIELMHKRRKTDDINKLTNGPGKLTRAFNITKELNGMNIFKKNAPLKIEDSKNFKFKIVSASRIGVADKSKLRFYIKGNKFVSVT